MTHTPKAAPETTDVRGALKDGMARLRGAGVPSHTLAAELLLMHALGRDRAWIYSHPEEQLGGSELGKYISLIARRAGGEPTQYLTGKQEFWGLEFEVTPAVLIPRQETEHVVEVALERLGERGIVIDLVTGEPRPPLRVADVGTGSGCLAIALAHELPYAEVMATDISPGAIEVARRNAARHGVARQIRFVETDLLEAMLEEPEDKGARAARFDLIVSNPPYVARHDADSLAQEIRAHEPEIALFGGPTGVEMYARLVEQAAQLLTHRGTLVMELGYDSADRVGEMLRSPDAWMNQRVTNDLAGIPRVISALRR